jgi:hypothetical protein
MPEVVYRPEILVERLEGSVRRAQLPADSTPTYFGTHGAVAAHYGRAAGTFEPHATTLDHLIAATGG